MIRWLALNDGLDFIENNHNFIMEIEHNLFNGTQQVKKDFFQRNQKPVINDSKMQSSAETKQIIDEEFSYINNI